MAAPVSPLFFLVVRAVVAAAAALVFLDFDLDGLRGGLSSTVPVVDEYLGSLKLNIRGSPGADTTGGEGIAGDAGGVC